MSDRDLHGTPADKSCINNCHLIAIDIVKYNPQKKKSADNFMAVAPYDLVNDEIKNSSL